MTCPIYEWAKYGSAGPTSFGAVVCGNVVVLTVYTAHYAEWVSYVSGFHQPNFTHEEAEALTRARIANQAFPIILISFLP